MYAVWLHRLSSKWLRVVTAVSACGLAVMALGNFSGSYNIGMGWTLAEYGFLGGFFRLSFSFSIGLLMSRGFRPRKIRSAFWLCSAMLAAIFATPYVGGASMPMLNAGFDLACTLFIFPAIVYIGACGTTTDATSTRICDTLGQLSYPVYIIHYPVMYLFYAWVWSNGKTLAEAWPVGAVLFVAILLMAWPAYRFYDLPVRTYLTHRFLRRR